MRTRRFRPSVGFRPDIDLLMPRIAPSDIAIMLYLDKSDALRLAKEIEKRWGKK